MTSDDGITLCFNTNFCPISFGPFSFFCVSFQRVKTHWKNIFIKYFSFHLKSWLLLLVASWNKFIIVWSYASHRAQCGVTTSHSTCGCCVHDYHVSFRLFALSSPSMSTLCLKDPRRELVDTIQPDLLLTVRLYEWLDCLATERIEKTHC